MNGDRMEPMSETPTAEERVPPKWGADGATTEYGIFTDLVYRPWTSVTFPTEGDE